MASLVRIEATPGGPINVHMRKARMTAEQKALHERILAESNPASVTRAERNQIYLDPPPEEEDRLCLEKVGLDMAGLRRKALDDPDSLSELEADILTKGAIWDPVAMTGRDAQWLFMLPNDERALAMRVRELLASEEHAAASRAAMQREIQFRPIKSERRKRRREERMREQQAAPDAPRPRWIHDMLRPRMQR